MKTPLSMAAFNGEDEIVKYLVKNGANPNQKFKNGDTILMWAVSNDKIDIVKDLISHGAEINGKDTDGYTALFRAISTDNENLVKLLVDRGDLSCFNIMSLLSYSMSPPIGVILRAINC